MKKYSTPEVIFDKFTTEEIAITLGGSVENDQATSAKLDFGNLFI